MTDLTERQLINIWRHSICPLVFAEAKPSNNPVTVFLGGQPAAGKTEGWQLAQSEISDLIPVIGDDFRPYHPQYRHLIKNDVTSMPAETAQASGRWIGMCVNRANRQRYSILIEGTWRNADTVLREARIAKDLGRRTWAIIIATPPILSRLGMLSRFYGMLQAGREARWTPPQAHDHTVRLLHTTVSEIAQSDLIDRFTVTNRQGNRLYDSTKDDRSEATRVWKEAFDRSLTDEEAEFMRRELIRLDDLYRRFTPDKAEILAELRKTKNMFVDAVHGEERSFPSGSSSQGMIHVSGHIRHGHWVNDYWRNPPSQ